MHALSYTWISSYDSKKYWNLSSFDRVKYRLTLSFFVFTKYAVLIHLRRCGVDKLLLLQATFIHHYNDTEIMLNKAPF